MGLSFNIDIFTFYIQKYYFRCKTYDISYIKKKKSIAFLIKLLNVDSEHPSKMQSILQIILIYMQTIFLCDLFLVFYKILELIKKLIKT